MSDRLPNTEATSQPIAGHRLSWLWDVLLIAVLILGASFRLVGLDWDEGQHLHPDERFLTMVETGLQAPASISSYLDTRTSLFNPHNVGYNFFVYGTLPIFITYFVGQWADMSGYGSIYLVGRFLSAAMDVGTILLTFLIASRLFRKHSLGLLAAAFIALAVLPIQLSHFFAVDTFLNFFIYLAIYFGVRILTRPAPPTTADMLPPEDGKGDDEQPALPLKNWLMGHWGGFAPYALFGFAVGCAMASKVTAVPLAVLLPLSAYIWWTKLPDEQRVPQAFIILRNLVLAGLIAFITFRIFQPYVFTGPGFFGLKINELWMTNMRELQSYSGGDVDFPPALQWARRPIWFAAQNLIIWGLGLPLGILAWVGFLWAGWRMLRGEWRTHLILWVWVAFNFAWQSLNFTRSMRYQLPIYPALAIFAAWVVFDWWERGGWLAVRRWRNTLRTTALALGIITLVGTLLWAFAFTRIYTRPHTRVEASRWIYQNISGPMNLEIDSGDQVVNQPVGIEHSTTLQGGNSLHLMVEMPASGTVTQVNFDQISDPAGDADLEPEWDEDFETLLVYLSNPSGETVEGSLACTFSPGGQAPCAAPYIISLSTPLVVQQGENYHLEIILQEMGETLRFSGAARVDVYTGETSVSAYSPDFTQFATAAAPFIGDTFSPRITGEASQLAISHLVDLQNPDQEKTLQFAIYQSPDIGTALAIGSLTGTFAPEGDPRGQSYTVELDQPVLLDEYRAYVVGFQLTEGDGQIGIYGNNVALETSWDDPLPVPLDGYDPYPRIYRGDLNFEMYWDDDANKLNRFTTTLDRSDYLFMTSNRQWGTTVRVPERYPLTTEYYRNLLGCPEEKDVFLCYAVAQPGMFEGKLGYELVKVFESYPNLGSLRFNSQFAEEAFTVYDAPKVMIFRKTDGYDPQAVRDILGAVDLSQAIHLSPKQASDYKGNLTLPEDRLAAQRAGGTWSDLFDTNAVFNRYPALAAVLWYVVVTLLGWVVYPFVRLALGGLADRGYPFARFSGMLLVALFSWLIGSLGGTFSRLTITLVIVVLVLVNAVLAFLQRESLAREWRERRNLILLVEGLALLAFLLFLLVRLGNPDLWHPYKGGEKPMDFSYFNAVLKSTSFPPYDPWYAGGYINYYYYGFVIVGVLVKWLGIVPAIAYNLILPTLFSVVALAAFSLGWNLSRTARPPLEENGRRGVEKRPVAAGLLASTGMLIVGNLGTVRMIWHGLMRIASDGNPIENANIIDRVTWTFAGLFKFLGGARFPFQQGQWYWDPSRAIATGAGNEITEFPLFTFLYADLHAHMMALPVTMLALAVAVAVLLGRWQWGLENGRLKIVHFAATLFLGAAAVGALRGTNTWDMPVYLVLAGLAFFYAAVRYSRPESKVLRGIPESYLRIAIGAGSAALLLLGTMLLAQPFSHWYAQAYNSVDLWTGPKSPISSYLVHWGLFLFILVSWLFWAARDWMAKTPLSAARPLVKARYVIYALIFLVLAVFAVLIMRGVVIAWVALPIALAAAILLLRRGQHDAQRAVLFMIGSGMALTLMVEVIVLKGDIGRMNTVFKFYLQAWTLLSISSAVALSWLLPEIEQEWTPGWKNAWWITAILLVTGGLLFLVMAGRDKITDRMSTIAPHTLDGMAYMQTSTYADFDVLMDLNQDYKAIRWMQENVKGSPVIVEANAPLYHWASRFSTYTGLPGVVGWDWHQIQQRAVLSSDVVSRRVNEVHSFYQTTSRDEVEDFLRKYEVRYVIVGQLERAEYPGIGMQKFSDWNGDLWNEVYREGDTVIYEVVQ